MNKTAAVEYPVHELIKKRWSPRAYSPQMVSREQLMTLFEAACWAASCHNEQPWRFIYATKENPTEYKRLFNCLHQWNKNWVHTAPALIVAIAKRTFSHNLKPNNHAWHDVGMAVATMALQASSMNLQIHCMAGFDIQKTIEDLYIPTDLEPVCFITVGYEGSSADLEGEYRELEEEPRKRMPLEKLVRQGSFLA